MATLIARREVGGLLVAASKLVANLTDQIALFRQILDIHYNIARQHMKLWVHWPRITAMLTGHDESCRKRGVPFIVPGYARCLRLAGITRMPRGTPTDPPPPVVMAHHPPTEIEALLQRLAEVELQNRLEREKSVRLAIELDTTREEIEELRFNARRSPEPEQKPTWLGRAAGWVGIKRRPLPPPQAIVSPSNVTVRIGNCLDLIETEANIYHAIVTDPPYAISLHGYAWDSTDISFSAALWERLFRVLKPGGFIAFFAAPRLYHRAATACENAGFELYPSLGWRFRDGLPKPINLSELFDRDNLAEREIIGTRRGSGFTQANVDHGAQARTHVTFAMHSRHVSDEAQTWRGFYYGVNALKPCMEPVVLAQKPISERHMIDNVRRWGTGALNIGALRDRYGLWPSTLFTHRKATGEEHQSDHPSVKPQALMEDLCTLLCPGGGHILDPFCGTGTTGIAAQAGGFDCTLIESNPEMEEVIRRRIRM